MSSKSKSWTSAAPRALAKPAATSGSRHPAINISGRLRRNLRYYTDRNSRNKALLDDVVAHQADDPKVYNPKRENFNRWLCGSQVRETSAPAKAIRAPLRCQSSAAGAPGCL